MPASSASRVCPDPGLGDLMSGARHPVGCEMPPSFRDLRISVLPPSHMFSPHSDILYIGLNPVSAHCYQVTERVLM